MIPRRTQGCRHPGSAGTVWWRAAAALAIVALAGCGPQPGSIAGGGVRHVDEKLKNRPVSVRVGARLELIAHSDLSTVRGSSQPRVLASLGALAYLLPVRRARSQPPRTAVAPSLPASPR
jgi:hypothetical protein